MKKIDMKKFLNALISQSDDNLRTKQYYIFQYPVQGIFFNLKYKLNQIKKLCFILLYICLIIYF